MIEFLDGHFDGDAPWYQTDEDYPDVKFCLEQLFAQMMGWA